MNELNLIEESSSVPIYQDALHFDNDTYVDKVEIGSDYLTNTRTVSLWVKLDAATYNGQPRNFMFAQYAGSGQRTTYFEFRDTGVIRGYIPTSSSGNSSVLIESNAGQYFNANQWYYISITLTGTRAELYVDNVMQTQTVTTSLPFTRSGAVFTVGNFGTTLPSFGFKGTIRDLSVWNTARTQAELLADETRVFTGSESGLKGHWKFYEGSGTTVTDASGTQVKTITTTNPTPNYIDDFMWVRDVIGTSSGGIEKSKIDLFEGQFVSITKQSFDVNNLTQRLAGVTNNFTLPFTANNSEVFDYLDLNGTLSNKPYQINYVEYIQEGTSIIKKGRMNVKEVSTAGYKVDVTHGINDFFDRIRDKFFHQPFVDRSPNGVYIDATNLQNYSDPIYSSLFGITFPIADYYQSTPLPEYQSTPYAKVSDAFDFIAEDAGYTFIDNTNGRLDNKLFSGSKLFEYKEERQDISAFYNLSGISETVVNTYYTKRTGVVFGVYSMKFEVIAGLGFSIGIYTYADGVQVGFYGISPAALGTFTDYSTFLTSSPTVYPKGTKIETIVKITSNPAADLKLTFGDYGFADTSAVGVTETETCFLDNIFGDLTQIDFISYIFELFNLGFEVDEINKQIISYSLNDVYDPNVGTIVDFSDYYSSVMNKKFESSFGRLNNFKYKYQNERPEIYNGTLLANNTNKNKDLVNSEITASFHDQTFDLGSFKPFVLKAKGYEDSDLRTGSNDIGYRVLNYNIYDSAGLIPSAIKVFGTMSFDILSYSGTTSNVGFSFLTLTNSEKLDWGSLVEDNYSSLRDYVLNRYQELKLLMRVPNHLIDTFSFQNKIFISQLNSSFVVQSIKTRPDGLSEWIIIKLN